ncbi:MAG: LIC_12616 family protein [Sodalis sp. (in: enterobacteria)]|uniref:phage neck terminator protein n=1 Tax=Sodalis sp. (in: enterobacteria) TaxID=1898979 RepID=UPI0039E2FB42
MMQVTLTLDDILDVLQAFLVGNIGIGEVWSSQVNRVPMPHGDVAIMTPLFFKRLGTTWATNQDTGNTDSSTVTKHVLRTLDVQIDLYGRHAAENAVMLETLFRDGYAVDAIHALHPAITPLYASDVHQNVFNTDAHQYLERYIVTLTMQTQIDIIIPQAFFDWAAVSPYQADQETLA